MAEVGKYQLGFGGPMARRPEFEAKAQPAALPAMNRVLSASAASQYTSTTGASRYTSTTTEG
jgi:hypothetical protein